MIESEKDPAQQVEAARKAFELDFERFARFTVDSVERPGLSLKAAEDELRSLAELRTRHSGKKSALAACKKLIGGVAPEDRAAFGQLVQQTQSRIVQALEEAEAFLKVSIETARTESESLDVTIPGR